MITEYFVIANIAKTKNIVKNNIAHSLNFSTAEKNNFEIFNEFIIYRTRATITRSWLETALEY